MADHRKEDGPIYRNWFRSDRTFEDGGRWYFYTREGTMEGPCNSRGEAQTRLDIYLASLQQDLSPAATLATVNHRWDRFIQ